MNISKDLLEEFNIVSMSLKSNNKSISCFPVKVELNKSILTKTLQFKYLQQFSDETETSKFFTEEKHILSVTIKKTDSENFTISDVKIDLIESGLDYFICKVNDCDDFFQSFLNRISFLEYQDEKYGRRKEPRIAIGKDKADSFGLASIEQKLFSKTEKLIQSCVILDVSLHGICIITPFENTRFKSIDNFFIQISFTNPEQNIVLQAHKVHLKLNPTKNKIYATLSCQLLEPISYIWKERVIKMFELESSN